MSIGAHDWSWVLQLRFRSILDIHLHEMQGCVQSSIYTNFCYEKHTS